MKKNRKRISDFSVPALLVLCVAVMCALPASAQESSVQPRVLTNPTVNLPIHFAISAPLSELAKQEVSPPYNFHEVHPPYRPHLQLLKQLARDNQGRPVTDEALQTSIGPNVGASIGLNFLGLGYGFPDYSTQWVPPDTNMAVGDTQVAEFVNSVFDVFDKSTGDPLLSAPAQGYNLFTGAGGNCDPSTGNYSVDPIVQWDKLAHRWMLLWNTFYSGSYTTCMAISKTKDATGSWYLYQYPQNDGFPDYPKWGVWSDAYYQTQNISGYNAYVCAYESAKLVKGNSKAQQICFTTDGFDTSLQPGDIDSASTLPPKGEPEVYLGAIDNSNPGTHVYEYLFHVDFVHPKKSTFKGVGGTMPIKVAKFSLACGGFSDCIPQKGTSDVNEALGDRLMYRLAYRNFGDHQTWLVTHDVTTTGGQVGPRWYEFRAPKDSTKLTVYQQGTFAPDSNYRWMGSIAMDKAGDIALGYSISSSSMYPSISFTGRVPSDSKGTMETEAQIVAGTAAHNGSSERWGDYSAMRVDPSDDCTFWYTQEYYLSEGDYTWSSQIASLKFPGCS